MERTLYELFNNRHFKGLKIGRTFEGGLMVMGDHCVVGVEETHAKSIQLQWVVCHCSHNYKVIVFDVVLL